MTQRKTGPPVPKSNTVIWRYMSLHAFLTLLTEQRLVFRQFKKLEDSDAREGMAIEGFWESMLPGAESDELKARSEKMLEDLRYLNYASCWSMSEIENALMWKGYARQGIAVKTTVDKLKRAEQKETERISIRGNEIVYADNWRELENQGYHHDDIPLHVLFLHTKRKAFASESEVRFRIQPSFPAALKYPGKPPPDLTKVCPHWFALTFEKLDWIEQVVAESSIPSSAVETIRQLVERRGLAFRQSGI